MMKLYNLQNYLHCLYEAFNIYKNENTIYK